METIIQPRFLTEPHVYFHSQINADQFEEPIPEGIFGVTLQEGGRPYVDVLDQEVAIYSRVVKYWLNPYYMAATVSMEDALSLRDGLMVAAEAGKVKMEDQAMILQQDVPARARILNKPTVELMLGGVVITSLVTPTDRIRAFVVNQEDALKLARGISEVLEQNRFRGSAIVDVLNKVTPGKVVSVG